MNGRFAEYATSTAFCVMLSKNQCNHLLRLSEWVDKPSHNSLLTVGALKTLEARGLVSWGKDEHGRTVNFEGLTEAGRITVLLMREAGLTVDNTNTVGMLARLDRQ